MKRIDLSGQRFGKLLVLRKAEGDEIPTSSSQARHPQAWWLVRCDCQREKIVRGNVLKIDSKSCGRSPCVSRKTRPVGEAAKWHAYVSDRGVANRRGIVWALSLEQFLDITSRPCTYCGVMGRKVAGKNLNGEYRYNGIDRVNNDVGYTPANSAPCCGSCNRAKGEMAVEEFRSWVARVHQLFSAKVAA